MFIGALNAFGEEAISFLFVHFDGLIWKQWEKMTGKAWGEQTWTFKMSTLRHGFFSALDMQKLLSKSEKRT